MKITIEDHSTAVNNRRNDFGFDIAFFVDSENEFNLSRNLHCNFTDLLSFFQAEGIIDAFDAEREEGLVWMDNYSYTFDELIKEHFDIHMDKRLAEYVAVKVSEAAAQAVIEDLVLCEAA